MKTKFFVICFVLGFTLHVVAAMLQSDDVRLFRSIGLSGNRAQIEQAAAEAESLWPNNIEKYSECYYRLIMGFPAVKHPEYLPLLEKLVFSVVVKEETKPLKLSDDASGGLLGVQTDAIILLLSTARQVNTAGKDRIRYAALAKLFIGRLSKELIPNFKPKAVTANVIPPISSGPMMAGMNPDAIKDPVAREAYIKAREENSQNSVLNSRQHSLREWIHELNSVLTSFLKNTVVKYPAFKDEAEKILHDLSNNTGKSATVPSDD